MMGYIYLLRVSGIQPLITHQIVSSQAGANIVSMLAQLMDWNFDSIRVLQTSMLLLSTTTCVRGKTLSNCLSLCFRLLGSGKASLIFNPRMKIYKSVIPLNFANNGEAKLRVKIMNINPLSCAEQKYCSTRPFSLQLQTYQSKSEKFYIFRNFNRFRVYL